MRTIYSLESVLKSGDHVVILGWTAQVRCNPVMFLTCSLDHYSEVIEECIIKRFINTNTIKNISFISFAIAEVNGEIKLLREFDKCRSKSVKVGEYLVVEKVGTRYDANVVIKWKSFSLKKYPYKIGDVEAYIEKYLTPLGLDKILTEAVQADEIQKLPKIYSYIISKIRSNKIKKII